MTKLSGRRALPVSHSPASASLPQSRRLSRLLGILVIALLAPATACPQAPAIAPPPDWVELMTWTAPTRPEVNPTGRDYLLLDDQTKLATDESYHRHAFQIVSDAGRQSGSQVYIDFDPSFQSLTIHRLELVRDGKTANRLDPAKIQVIQQERDLDRQLYNGERSALVILDDVRIGDIIDVAYTLRGRNPVFDGKFIDSFYLEWGTPVRDLRNRLLVPAGRRVFHRQLPAGPAAAQTGFTTVTRGNETELAWRRTNIPIVESEEHVPDSHYVFSFVDVTEFASWAEVAEWARPLYALDLEPHPLLDATVAELQQKGATPEARAVAALAFVQEEIRYLGIEMGPGSHRPSEPEEVLRRRFGDCKDKARLLTALLQRMDLPAFPALVHSEDQEAVRGRPPSPYAFDHVIVALDLGGSRRYLLDPTMSSQRGARLDLRHVGNYGPYLRIAPGTVDLEDARLGDADISRTTIQQDFQVDQLDKPARLTVTTTAEGPAADSLRSYYATRSLDQIGREYLDYYTRYHRGITQRAPLEHQDDPANNTYVTKEHYTIEGFFDRQTEDDPWRAGVDPAGIWDLVRPPNLAQRRLPYALGYPLKLSEIITINLPEDWRVKAEQETVTDDAFTLTYRSSNPTPRSVKLEYTWTARQARVEPKRLAEFSAHIDQARRKLGYQLSWHRPARTTTAATPEGYAPHWPMIALAAGILLGGGYLTWRLARRPNPVPPEPPLITPPPSTDPYSRQARAAAAEREGLGGWLVLIAIGLFVRPALLLFAIFQARDGYFSEAAWRIMTTAGSEHYQPHYTLLASLELIVNFTLLSYALGLLVLFFRRSHLFPRVFQIYLGLCVLAAIFDIWDHSMMADVTSEQQMAAYKQLVQTAIGAAIWIPYFQISRRVKLTFVR